MAWQITSLNLSVSPVRDVVRTFETEAEFMSALNAARADLKTQIVSATLDNGTVLNEAELRKRYP
jgi:hypothetical protein